jgi:hypothetical protein
MNKLSWRIALLAGACASVWAVAADAQSVSGGIRTADSEAGIFARDRGVTVRDRPRPDYEAIGLPVGAFTLYPRLQLDADHNDNIFARDTDEKSDTIIRLRPEAQLRSNWSRHAVNLFARGVRSEYLDTSSENTTDWATGGSGRLEVGRGSNITLGADTGRATESRTSNNTPQQSRSPIRFDQTQAYLAGVSVINRVKLSGRFDYRRYDYDDGRTLAGAVIEQDDRDRTVTSLTGRADYAISPAISVFAQVSGSKRDYKTIVGGAAPRDSDGQEFLVGSSFEIGALMRAEAAVGYVTQNYDNSAYRDISGFGARAEFIWMPTQLTTLTLTGSRTIEDAGIVNSAGYLSTAISAQVDHELLRNLILTGLVSYGHDDFKDLNRNDDRWGVSASATYLLNRHLSVAAALSRSTRDVQGVVGQDYEQNRFMITIVSQY